MPDVQEGGHENKEDMGMKYMVHTLSGWYPVLDINAQKFILN